MREILSVDDRKVVNTLDRLNAGKIEFNNLAEGFEALKRFLKRRN